MLFDLPPFVLFFAAALLVPFLRGWPRAILLLGVPVLGGVNLLGVEHGVHWQVDLLGYSLEPWRVDRLSLLFGYLFHVAAFLANLYALHLVTPSFESRAEHPLTGCGEDDAVRLGVRRQGRERRRQLAPGLVVQRVDGWAVEGDGRDPFGDVDPYELELRHALSPS